MPPTWAILAYFYLTYHLNFLLVVLIGALLATAGRLCLSWLARTYFRRFLSKPSQENIHALGRYFTKNKHASLPLLLVYAFLPIPSSHVYITAGLADIDIRFFAMSFFFGRIISYLFWVNIAHIIVTRLDVLFASQLSQSGLIVVEVVGFIGIYILTRIPWQKFFIKTIKK